MAESITSTVTGTDMSKVPVQLLRREELATHLGIHPRTISRWVEAGKIPAIHIGRSLRFDLDKVLAALGEDAPGRSVEAAIGTAVSDKSPNPTLGTGHDLSEGP